MPILKRYYALIVTLLFILISYLFIIAERGASTVSSTQIQDTSKNFNAFVYKLFPNQKKSDLHFLKIDRASINKLNKNVLEIDEANFHQVSLITNENGKFKALNWYKCKPNSQVFLSTNPFFIFSNKTFNNDVTIVYNGLSLNAMPVKLFTSQDFFIRKANQESAKTIIAIILVLILTASLFVFIITRSLYSILFSIYIFFCFVSNIVYNGFANNFWPFNNYIISDHFLGMSLSIHIFLMSIFLVYLVRKHSHNNIFRYLSHLPLIISIAFLLIAGIYESYIILKFQLVFAFILCLCYTLYYPIIFSNYKAKNAYWLNYFGIIFFMLLMGISAAKYFNLLIGNTLFEISHRILFLSHVISVFFAFILITKTKLFQFYANANTSETKSENDELIVSNSVTEILATLSEREYIVLELLSSGLKDLEIADQLNVSVSTIKTHKQRLYRKLEVNNRTQASQVFIKFKSKTFNLVN